MPSTSEAIARPSVRPPAWIMTGGGGGSEGWSATGAILEHLSYTRTQTAAFVRGVCMAVSTIKMPQLGESVTEGTVDKWLKREGDFVKRDEPLVEVVTDKVNAEIPSPFEGKLVKIAVGEGETVRVGSVIAQIETAAGAPAPAAGAPAKEKATPDQPTVRAPAPVAAPPATPPPTEAANGGEHFRLSPAVRKLAAEHSIDPTSLRGSGLGGRVTRDDVLAAVGQGATAALPAAQAPAPARIDGK